MPIKADSVTIITTKPKAIFFVLPDFSMVICPPIGLTEKCVDHTSK
jgi:hypothetical protein